MNTSVRRFRRAAHRAAATTTVLRPRVRTSLLCWLRVEGQDKEKNFLRFAQIKAASLCLCVSVVKFFCRALVVKYAFSYRSGYSCASFRAASTRTSRLSEVSSLFISMDAVEVVTEGRGCCSRL